MTNIKFKSEHGLGERTIYVDGVRVGEFGFIRDYNSYSGRVSTMGRMTLDDGTQVKLDGIAYFEDAKLFVRQYVENHLADA